MEKLLLESKYMKTPPTIIAWIYDIEFQKNHFVIPRDDDDLEECIFYTFVSNTYQHWAELY